MNWDAFSSIATGVAAFIAMLALIALFYQIWQSNKQQLFDKRLEVFLLADGLVKLYERNRSELSKIPHDEPLFTVELDFIWLTNNSYLEKMANAIKKPLEQPAHGDFLRALEDLEAVATKFRLLFGGDEANWMASFITNYRKTLFAMYKYKGLIDQMSENSNRFGWTEEEAQEKLHEPSRRKALLQLLQQLEESFITVEENDALSKLEKHLKLTMSVKG
jgi:hypothetical protein